MSAYFYQTESDTAPWQQVLRQKLGITELLQARETWLFEDQLNVEIYPGAADAPVLLFLPGIGTYVELYAELLTALCAEGINVIAIDPPGHGYSRGQRGRFDVSDLSSTLSRLIDQLETRFRGRWSVYGYSIGAVSGLALAERDKRIETVICGTLLLSEVPPDLIHALGWSWTALSAVWFPSITVPLRSFIDFEALLGSHPAGQLINQDNRIVFDYPLATLASLFRYSAGIVDRQFAFELIILQGDRDEVLSLSYARRVIATVVQPVRLDVIEGAGHMLPWDDPQGLASRITAII